MLTGNSEQTERFGFVLIPGLSMMAFASAVEPLRIANRLAEEELYHWELLSSDGYPVVASNGIPLAVACKIDDARDIATIVVCGGIDTHRFEDLHMFAWLRRMEREGAMIGAICTGGHLLANAGLLKGYRCTIHWENLAGFSEQFPDIEVSAQLFEFDRNRFTCAGGTASADMMLHMIGSRHGHELAGEVAEQIIHERIRAHDEQQPMTSPAHLGQRNAKLLRLIELMRNNLEEPLTRGELAREVGISTRQLERLFRKYLNKSPARYYLELRLHKARRLLLQTNMSVMNVALACGFISASHFTKCYRAFFGRTPYRERGLQSQPALQKVPA